MVKKYFLIFLGFIIFGNTNAQIPIYNTEFKIAEEENSYSGVTVCGLSNKNIVFAYGYNSINYQVFDENGDRIVINRIFKEYSQIFNPRLAPLSNGGFVIVFYGSSEGGLFGQVFGSDGQEEKRFKIIDIQPYYNIFVAGVTGLKDGGFITVFQNLVESSWEVFYKKYTNTGNEVSENIQVNSSVEGSQSSPNITELINGNFVIIWESKYDEWKDGYKWNRQHIMGQMYNALGERVGDEFQVSTAESNFDPNSSNIAHYSPRICQLSNGGFVVVWVNRGSLFFQIYNENGVIVVNEIPVSNNSNVRDEYPSICNLSNGDFVIIWRTYKYGLVDKINCQIYSESGEKIGDEFQINENIHEKFGEPYISSITENEFMTIWPTTKSQYTGPIYARKYLQEPIQHNLKPFAPTFPTNNITIKPSKPLFTWQSASSQRINFPWELKYDLVIADNIEFSDPLKVENLIDTTYQMIYWLEPDTTYYWKVLAKNFYGDSLWSSIVHKFYVDPNIVDVEAFDGEIPTSPSLSQNYPNPFNPTTVIKFGIPYKTHVTLKVYNILGKEVATLVSGEKSSGSHKVEFNPSADGNELTSGIYFYRIITDRFSETKKMILMR